MKHTVVALVIAACVAVALPAHAQSSPEFPSLRVEPLPDAPRSSTVPGGDSPVAMFATPDGSVGLIRAGDRSGAMVFDRHASAWSLHAANHAIDRTARAVTLTDGSVFVSGPGATDQLFDPHNGRWRDCPASPLSPREYPLLVALGDGTVLIAGDTDVESRGGGGIFDPHTWTYRLAPGLEGPWLFGAQRPNGSVVLLGSDSRIGEYDPTTGRLESRATRDGVRSPAELHLLADGSVLVLGDVFRHDPEPDPEHMTYGSASLQLARIRAGEDAWQLIAERTSLAHQRTIALSDNELAFLADGRVWQTRVPDDAWTDADARGSFRRMVWPVEFTARANAHTWFASDGVHMVRLVRLGPAAH